MGVWPVGTVCLESTKREYFSSFFMEEVDVLLGHVDNWMVARFADRSPEFV